MWFLVSLTQDFLTENAHMLQEISWIQNCYTDRVVSGEEALREIHATGRSKGASNIGILN